jgi:hypothetical protein
MTTPIPDFLVLAPTLAAKLAGIVVHADEFTGPGAHHFDMAAIRALVADPEVRDWIERCGPLAPQKRR